MRHRRGTTSAHPGVLAVLVGAVLAVGAPTLWYLSQPPSTPANLDPGVAAALAAAPAAVPSSTGQDLPSRNSGRTATVVAGGQAASGRTSAPPGTPKAPAKAAAVVTVPTGSGSRSETTSPSAAGSATSPAVALPTRLRIDALGLDAPVVPIGVDRHGDLAIPHEVATVGWYSFGAPPGSAAGSVVMAGHVDSAQQGIGAFHALWSATPGMTVYVDRKGASSLTYRVVSRETFAKSTVPLSPLFSTSGAARLTLITCGGSFDHQTLSYDDNVVVTAVPA